MTIIQNEKIWNLTITVQSVTVASILLTKRSSASAQHNTLNFYASAPTGQRHKKH